MIYNILVGTFSNYKKRRRKFNVWNCNSPLPYLNFLRPGGYSFAYNSLARNISVNIQHFTSPYEERILEMENKNLTTNIPVFCIYTSFSYQHDR